MKGLITTKKEYTGSGKDGEKTKDSRWVLAATFLIPALIVTAILFLLISYQGGIETAVGDLALLLPLGWSFAAGMVASVNPCGIMMLTSYTFYQVRAEGASASTGRRVLRGLWMASVITLGFVAVIALAGWIIGIGGRRLVNIFPYAGLVIGVAMIGLGVWLLVTRKTISILGGKPKAIDPQRSLVNAFLFGIVYALGSLSCTLPIFLAVVGGSLAGDEFHFYFGQFVLYALGMGSVIFIVMIGAALFRRAMAQWLRTLTPHVHRLSTMFMIGAGLYLIYYWLVLSGSVL
jgi:cytochrome c biogenesis protein CcdA